MLNSHNAKMRFNTGEARETFYHYLRSHGVHWSGQRDVVLNTFLNVKGHLTIDEIHTLVRKRNPRVGYATVHRAMKLICESGIGEGVKFGGGAVRYELLHGHRHHHHLICLKCGDVLEVVNEAVEGLQEQMARQHRFVPQSHRFLIYGSCSKCNQKLKEQLKEQLYVQSSVPTSALEPVEV